jgi:GDP dissociation inhibitor
MTANSAGLNMSQATMKDVYDKFGLEATTRDFIGHSMALYQTDEYIEKPGMAQETVQRIRLYVNSMARYGKSPYIYPQYGLGELPQGFARLSAIYGGTYMLNTNVDEVLYENGKVSGIKATMKERGEEDEGMKFETKTKKILADPSYFPGKVRVVGHLLKAICILDHPLANTDNSDSCQLIIPQSQVRRRNGTSLLPDPELPLLTFQTSTSPWCRRSTTCVRAATILRLCRRLRKAKPITTLSCSPGSSGWARSKRSSWARRSRCTSRWTTGGRTTSICPRATTRRATLRRQPTTSRTFTSAHRASRWWWRGYGRDRVWWRSSSRR